MQEIVRGLAFAAAIALAVYPVSGHASSTTAPGARSQLKPLTAAEFKTKNREEPARTSVRDHLRLQPVTAEEFKATRKKDEKSKPSVRDHLNLAPLKQDDFKRASGGSDR